MILELEKALRFKATLRSGKPCLGAQLALSDPAVAEIFGRAGYYWLVVDTEHSCNNGLRVRRRLEHCSHRHWIIAGVFCVYDQPIISSSSENFRNSRIRKGQLGAQ